MANELANAVALMEDETFRKWIKAAIVYQSRLVITEPDTTADHPIRVALASIAAPLPERYLDMFVNTIAADPTVAGAGTQVGTQITQTMILNKIEQVWTPVAKLLVTDTA